MKEIKINAYNYDELNEKSKYQVKIWLDEVPFDYENEDEQGNIITKLDYPSDWSDEDINDHCLINGYLFDESGKCVHHLQNN